ncbi:MAG: glycosyltransferase [Solirubrobacterales bacterium]
MIALEVIFWVAAGLLVFGQLGYPLLLAAWVALAGRREAPAPVIAGEEPFVALVVAAHREAPVIAGRVENVRGLDWPADRLQLIVACDGSPDETPVRAREAGADLVLELPWGGKVRAQDAAVRAADPRATVVAFSDANASWEPQALRELAAALAEPGTGYACGSVTFTGEDGATNQEGLYWR